MCSNRKPNVKYFRIFGSQATFLKKGPGNSKLDPKGEKAILVGYSSESKAYKLWIPSTTKIIKSRDVCFIKDVNNDRIESIKVDLLPNVNIRNEAEMLDKVDDMESEIEDNESVNFEETLDSSIYEDTNDTLNVGKELIPKIKGLEEDLKLLEPRTS